MCIRDRLCAIEKEASLLILCNNAKVGRTIQRIAEETGVAIMTTPVDTYAAGKLLSLIHILAGWSVDLWQRGNYNRERAALRTERKDFLCCADL